MFVSSAKSCFWLICKKNVISMWIPNFNNTPAESLKPQFTIKLWSSWSNVLMFKVSLVIIWFLSVVRRHCRRCRLLQIYWANFNQTWHKASLDKRNYSLFKWMTTPPFLRGDNNEIVTKHWRNLEIFFSKTIWTIFNKT